MLSARLQKFGLEMLKYPRRAKRTVSVLLPACSERLRYWFCTASLGFGRLEKPAEQN